MNKKLLIILLIGLVFLAGFTFVYAKHISKEVTPTKFKAIRGETRVEEPAVPVVQRIRTGTLSEKPKTLDDLKAAALNAGKPYLAPQDQMKADFADVEVTKMVTPAGIIDEWSLTECQLYVHDQPCCFYQPWPDYFDQYMNCVGTAEYWTFQDPNFRNDWNACGYPIYPVQPTQIAFFMNTPTACTVDVEFAVTWDYGTPNWGYPFPFYPAPDWSSGPITIIMPEAGNWYLTVAIDSVDRPCYHVPFFARFWLLNSDDFTDGPSPVYCPDVRYGFWVTGLYDGGSVRHQGYYYSDAYGGYYDIVDIKGGKMRIRSSLLTRDQNECELESLWYHKAAFGEWECLEPIREDLELCIVDIDTTVDPPETTWGSYYLVTPVDYGYAPDGMPDFNQMEPNWCGPAALSNCLWWCFAGGFPWYIISNWYGAWDPSIPPVMMAELAACMNTDASGTDVYDMQQCILDLNETYGFWLTETTIVQPTFEDIEYQIRLSQDVILLLGYWYFDGEQWFRLGGHYVTCSGVNWEFFLLSISDPFLNGYCDGLTPGDSSGGVFIAHNHPCDPPCHFDAGNVSHDYYQVVLDSPSPGGIISMIYEGYRTVFYGMNFTPELEPFMAPSEDPIGEVHTEIEYAVVICPGRPFVLDNKDSWNVFFGTSNYGEEGLETATWQYYPELINNGFEGTVILGTNADDLALGVTVIGEDIRFFPPGGLVCDTTRYESMQIEKCEAVFYHNVPGHELPLDVEMLGIGLDPAEGSLAGSPLGDAVIEKFVIHNTGDVTLFDLEWALFLDLDVNLPDPNTSFGGGDSLTNTMWAYDSTREELVVYVTLAPTSVGKTVPGMDIGDHNSYFYPYVPGGPYNSLDSMMNLNYWSVPTTVPANNDTFDYAYLMTSEKFDLQPSEKVLQEYLIWYDWQIPDSDYVAYRCKLYKIMRTAGFYRGDVGNFATGAASPGELTIADIVFLVNYVLRSGPPPLPFIDQGDVDCDGETKIEDIVFLTAYILRGSGVPPTDKNRFFETDYELLFSRPSLFADDQWMNLGVGCPLD